MADRRLAGRAGQPGTPLAAGPRGGAAAVLLGLLLAAVHGFGHAASLFGILVSVFILVLAGGAAVLMARMESASLFVARRRWHRARAAHEAAVQTEQDDIEAATVATEAWLGLVRTRAKRGRRAMSTRPRNGGPGRRPAGKRPSPCCPPWAAVRLATRVSAPARRASRIPAVRSPSAWLSAQAMYASRRMSAIVPVGTRHGGGFHVLEPANSRRGKAARARRQQVLTAAQGLVHPSSVGQRQIRDSFPGQRMLAARCRIGDAQPDDHVNVEVHFSSAFLCVPGALSAGARSNGPVRDKGFFFRTDRGRSMVAVDITQLILDDHHEQRRLFAILEQIDRSDTEALSAVWGRLAAFLELHAAAEEELFYPALLQRRDRRQRKAGVEDETWTPSTTTTRSGTRSRKPRGTRSAATAGTRRSPGRTWPTATTWPKKNARA